MSLWPVLTHLAISLGIGLLIGMERGWRSREEPEGSRVAGLRTFGLLGLLGGLAGLVSHAHGGALGAVLVAGPVAALVLGYLQGMQASRNLSATTLVVAVVTICLGVLATSGYAVVAAASAAVVTLVLSMRRQLHAWLQTLNETDVQATARFAIITAGVLPLLPNQGLGPYQAWNPRELWLVVVLVTGFSFAGYIANKRFGTSRGTLATAAIGGLYSSTAVTAALSRRLQQDEEDRHVLTAGIAIASALMFIRVLTLATLLATSVVPTLAAALAPATLIALGTSFWTLRRNLAGATHRQGEIAQRNPFELLSALGFAALVATMAIATRWAAAEFGDTGIAALVAITGSFDVDAAIVTVGGLPEGTLDPRTAGLVLAVPVLLNTWFKALLVIALAGWRGGRTAAMPLVLSGGAILAALCMALL